MDVSGQAHVIGSTHSRDFPIVNPFQAALDREPDVFVAKLNALGNDLVFSTYLGGLQGDHPVDIALDAAGNAYAVGNTNSTDFPVLNAIQPAKSSLSTKPWPVRCDQMCSSPSCHQRVQVSSRLTLAESGTIRTGGHGRRRRKPGLCRDWRFRRLPDGQSALRLPRTRIHHPVECRRKRHPVFDMLPWGHQRSRTRFGWSHLRRWLSE